MLDPLSLLSAISSAITISGYINSNTPETPPTRGSWGNGDVVPDYVIAQDIQKKFPGLPVYGSSTTNNVVVTEEYYQTIPVTACDKLDTYKRVIEQTWYGRPGGNPEEMTRQEFILHREARAKLWVMAMECRAGGVSNLTKGKDNYKVADTEVVEGSTRCVTETRNDGQWHEMRETCEEAERQEFITTKIGMRVNGALLRPHSTQVQDFRIGNSNYRMFEENIDFRGQGVRITGIAVQIQPTVWQVVDRF